MKNLKNTAIILIAFALLFACKTQEELKVVEKPEKEKIDKPEKDIEKVKYDDIIVKEEKVSLELLEEKDLEVHDKNRFFVILGSFEYKENAENFMQQLKEKGFEPFMLLTDFGFHRVSVDSFVDEDDARDYIQKIRSRYQAYNDTWLLIKK